MVSASVPSGSLRWSVSMRNSSLGLLFFFLFFFPFFCGRTPSTLKVASLTRRAHGLSPHRLSSSGIYDERFYQSTNVLFFTRLPCTYSACHVYDKTRQTTRDTRTNPCDCIFYFGLVQAKDYPTHRRVVQSYKYHAFGKKSRRIASRPCSLFLFVNQS